MCATRSSIPFRGRYTGYEAMLYLIVNIDKPGCNDLRQANRPAQHDYIEGFRDLSLIHI